MDVSELIKQSCNCLLFDFALARLYYPAANQYNLLEILKEMNTRKTFPLKAIGIVLNSKFISKEDKKEFMNFIGKENEIQLNQVILELKNEILEAINGDVVGNTIYYYENIEILTDKQLILLFASIRLNQYGRFMNIFLVLDEMFKRDSFSKEKIYGYFKSNESFFSSLREVTNE